MTKPSTSTCRLRTKRSRMPATSGRLSGSIQCMFVSCFDGPKKDVLVNLAALGAGVAQSPAGEEAGQAGQGRPLVLAADEDLRVRSSAPANSRLPVCRSPCRARLDRKSVV